MVQHQRVVVSPDVHHRHFQQLAPRHRRITLPLHDVFGGVAFLYHFKAGTYHPQCALLPFVGYLRR